MCPSRLSLAEAEVLASTLGSPSAGLRYHGSDLSTKLKLMGATSRQKDGSGSENRGGEGDGDSSFPQGTAGSPTPSRRERVYVYIYIYV